MPVQATIPSSLHKSQSRRFCVRYLVTLQQTPRTRTSPRAPGTENADRQTPNAFLSPPTSGTLFDVLSRKRRERRHRAPGTENADRQTPNAFLSPPTSGTLFDALSRKRRERRHRRERRERKTPTAKRRTLSYLHRLAGRYLMY